MTTTTADVSREIQEAFRRLMPPEARWSYWQDGNGPMFAYNTEPVNMPGDPVSGKFGSCIYEPYGRGSRTGKATRWRIQKDSTSYHALRRDAKARAYRMYVEWQSQQKGTTP
jgi:hypothetical protein